MSEEITTPFLDESRGSQNNISNTGKERSQIVVVKGNITSICSKKFSGNLFTNSFNIMIMCNLDSSSNQ